MVRLTLRELDPGGGSVETLTFEETARGFLKQLTLHGYFCVVARECSCVGEVGQIVGRNLAGFGCVCG